MKRFLLCLLLVLPSCALSPQPAFAHAPAELSHTVVSESYAQKCFTYAVRAAWGAVAQRRGAPMKFKFVPMEDIKIYFDSLSGVDLTPTDAIYIAQGLTLAEAIVYQGASAYGWTVASQWHEEDVPPDFERAVARFFAPCVNP